MNRASFLFGIALAVSGATAYAADPVPSAGEEPAATPVAAPANLLAPAPDTSAWACKYCKVDAGSSGWIAPSVGYVWDRSLGFADYRAREGDLWQPDLTGLWRWRGDGTADFVDASVSHAGLESRGADVSAGRQGLYRVTLGFHSIPYRFGTGETPFRGENDLTLPAGWTRAGSTSGMTDLPAALHRVTLDDRRDRIALGVAVMPKPALDVRFNWHRDVINGQRPLGASMMTLDSQLVRPLDQTLDRLDLSAGYRTALGIAAIALDSSAYSSDANHLYWQNPYSALSPGADAGQLALPPDNRAHRVSLTLGSAPAWPLQATAQLAYGRMLQDEAFLPATVNPNLATALPRASLDGRVDTTLAAVRASYSPIRALRLNADVLHDDRDNKTPVDAYTQVVMDTFTGGTRVNVPYSFTRDRWRISAERVAAPRIAVGFDNDRRQRQLVTSLDSTEQTVWTRLTWRAHSVGEVHLRASHAKREGTDTSLTAAENPLMRAFQASDRKRDELRGDVSVPVGSIATASVNMSYGRSRYPVEIGRTADRQLGYGAELAAQPLKEWTATLFASRDQMSSMQANSQGFAAPDWFADQDDVTTTAGASVARRSEKGLDLGADYVWSQFEGNVYMDVPAGATAFPALVNRLQDTRAYAAYPLRPWLALRLDVLYQRYQGRDWQLDNVAPATIPNLLALGMGAGSGDAAAAILSLRYSFDRAAESGNSGD